ncbi:hypothetical protein AB0M54_28620 [Actinoplanes sp. NPDC051470]|uniref:hypothetical protein n=1 Tax=unclassified Actinoplanes TaxID=2626549 RepID=UPI003436974D
MKVPRVVAVDPSGVELHVATVGDPADPPLLLIGVMTLSRTGPIATAWSTT